MAQHMRHMAAEGPDVLGTGARDTERPPRRRNRAEGADAQGTSAREQRASGPRGSLALPVVLFVLAALLLATSAAGSAQAALTYFSEQYDASIALPDIGITLVENGEDVSTRDYTGADDVWAQTQGELLAHMLDDGSSLRLGTAYPEALAVRNSGNIDEYVRVKVYRYWTDAEGNKLTGLAPDLIGLQWANLGSAWVEDEGARTAERTVLYYTGVLPVGESTAQLSDVLTISPELATKASQTVERTAEGEVVTTTYAYDGVRFVVEAEADAVQTHNAQDAIKSAWGVDVTIADDGSLSLG